LVPEDHCHLLTKKCNSQQSEEHTARPSKRPKYNSQHVYSISSPSKRIVPPHISHHSGSQQTRQGEVQDKEEEELVSAHCHAVVDPGTVVVHLGGEYAVDADAAGAAVVGAWRLPLLAFLTEAELFERYIRCLYVRCGSWVRKHTSQIAENRQTHTALKQYHQALSCPRPLFPLRKSSNAVESDCQVAQADDHQRLCSSYDYTKSDTCAVPDHPH